MLLLPLPLLAGLFVWLLPVLTGYSAKIMCSCVFVADRAPASVLSDELSLYRRLARIEVDTDARLVQVRSLLGLVGHTAVFRPGLGCALVNDADAATLQAQTLAPARASRPAYWPLGEQDTLPWPAAVDSLGMAAVLDSFLRDPDPDQPLHTRALVVIYDGKLVGERYAPGFDQNTRHAGWSMTKSVTSALVGILVRQGRLDIMAPAPVPEWRDDARSAITIDHLLRMSSGLDFNEFYFGRTDATNMLFLTGDAGGYAVQSPLAHEPGTHWSYSSGTSNILSRIVRQQFDDHADYLRFPYDSLFLPLGMYSAVMEPDAGGTYVGSSFMWATARDWARFGMLYLEGGLWQGRRILPEGWATYSGTRTPTAPHGQYGAHFWTNATEPFADIALNKYWPDVPADAYYASGFEGQQVVVIPSRRVVTVRLGYTPDERRWDTNAFLRAVLAQIDQP
ncbi:MAG: serine hydrolase [Bacteroidia bacterium]